MAHFDMCACINGSRYPSEKSCSIGVWRISIYLGGFPMQLQPDGSEVASSHGRLPHQVYNTLTSSRNLKTLDPTVAVNRICLHSRHVYASINTGLINTLSNSAYLPILGDPHRPQWRRQARPRTRLRSCRHQRTYSWHYLASSPRPVLSAT